MSSSVTAPNRFSKLLDHPDVREEVRLGGEIGVMALHGGIEAHTERIARTIARRTGASLYVVSQPASLGWHLPSTLYDPARSRLLATFVSHVRVAISVHGFGRRHLARSVLVGGCNHRWQASIADRIDTRTGLRVLDDPDAFPRGLKGLHPRNPVNLTAERGVQLELSQEARRAPFGAQLVEAVVEVITDHRSGRPLRA